MVSLLIVLLALFLHCSNAANYRVLVGWQTSQDAMGPQWYSLWFYPPSLTIAYGDSVTWESPTLELHNVVFTNGTRRSETQPNGVNLTAIAGVVGNTTHFTDYNLDYSSGFRANNALPYTLTFIPTIGSGTFQYYCSIHPGMDGQITVLARGQTAPQSPAQVNQAVDNQIAQMKAAANAQTQVIDAAQARSGPQVTHTILPDGSVNWQVVAGQMAHGEGMQMYARFLPTYLEIQQNDTVTWIVDADDPHWVFFNAAQTFPPIFANYDIRAGLPLNASISYVNPPYALGPIWFNGPAPSPVIPLQTWPNAAGVINSGLMFGPMGPPVFPKSISVRFTTLGVWRYSCPIHADLGMFGTVRVKAQGAPLCTNATVTSTCARLSGAVRGDPQFVGLLGQSYQVHGIDGGIYNLITDDNIQVNSKFTFISESDVTACPNKQWTHAGLANKIACWSHAGSYLSEIGVMDKKGNKLRISAGNGAQGWASVTLNDKPVEGKMTKGAITVEVYSSHHLSVVFNEFSLFIENSDGFVNLASVVVDRKRWSAMTAHGLIGQSWHRPRVQGRNKHFEGEVDDYLINESDLFGVDFMYNRFNMA